MIQTDGVNLPAPVRKKRVSSQGLARGADVRRPSLPPTLRSAFLPHQALRAPATHARNKSVAPPPARSACAAATPLAGAVGLRFMVLLVSTFAFVVTKRAVPQ